MFTISLGRTRLFGSSQAAESLDDLVILRRSAPGNLVRLFFNAHNSTDKSN